MASDLLSMGDIVTRSGEHVVFMAVRLAEVRATLAMYEAQLAELPADADPRTRRRLEHWVTTYSRVSEVLDIWLASSVSDYIVKGGSKNAAYAIPLMTELIGDFEANQVQAVKDVLDEFFA